MTKQQMSVLWVFLLSVTVLASALVLLSRPARAQTESTTSAQAETVDSNPLPSPLLGGQASIYNITPNAFGQPIPGLERPQELLFFVGNSFFNQNWVTAPASTTARDGLGPLFNARSCASCHFKDGRGRAPEFSGEAPTGFLLRLGINERDIYGERSPEPYYGMQFQDHAILDVPKEGDFFIDYEEIPGEYPDGTTYSLRKPNYRFENLAYGEFHPEVVMSGRVANQMIGLGLLEAINEDDLLSWADPNDQDGDGISGRPNWVWDVLNQRMTMGRFGWKAEQPSILQQSSAAFSGDIGITTDIFPGAHCAAGQDACLNALSGSNSESEPEIIADDLLKVTLYSSTLAVPVQRDIDSLDVQAGAVLFRDIGCSGCHLESVTTGIHPTIPALSHQQIRPYTNLLLHDMGDGLADGLSDFQATGREWRTPPLWGIGLFETVNKHTYYLHDGRARNLEEAILWHGGEAEASKDTFKQLSREQREQLLSFLGSL
ncbi:MAG: di-heme oxidoredictase family protein [Deinococcota bacterium]